MIYNFLQSCQLLSEACTSFASKCVEGIEPNRENIEKHLADSLMLVTALNPYIGYDKAARVAKKAYAENKTLKKAVVELGYLSAEEFDRIVRPESMIGPSDKSDSAA